LSQYKILLFAIGDQALFFHTFGQIFLFVLSGGGDEKGLFFQFGQVHHRGITRSAEDLGTPVQFPLEFRSRHKVAMDDPSLGDGDFFPGLLPFDLSAHKEDPSLEALEFHEQFVFQ